MWRRLGALGLTATMLGTLACTSDDETGSSMFGADGSLGAMLAGLPAEVGPDDAVAVVYLADFEAARQRLGIEAPGAGASEDEFRDYVQALVGPSEEGAGLPWPEGLSRDRLLDPATREAYRTQFGISLTEVDRYAEVVAMPSLVTVVHGEFSRDDVAAAVESDPDWSDDLENVAFGDTSYWSWLEDTEFDVQQVDQVHPLGRSTRLALVDDALVRTRTTPDMEATLAAVDGESTLADDDVMAALAAGLDGADAVAGALVTDVASFTVEGLAGRGPSREVVDELGEQTPTLAPYEGVAVGIAFGEAGVDEPVLVAVVQHSTPDLAEDNADRLRVILEDGSSLVSQRPWSELLDVQSVEADGARVVARLGIEIPAMWLSYAGMPGDLLVHD